MGEGRLEGKVALVTGGSRGIGEAIALRFAEEGCDVAVNYVPDADGENVVDAARVAKKIARLGRRSACLEADVTDPVAVTRMVGSVIDALWKIDILVNNAGIAVDGTLKNLEKPGWDAQLSVNLTGAYNVTRALIEHMRERRSGRIISIASVVGQMGKIGLTGYGASKAGLIGFTKSLAREVARRGITANAIAPGFIDTPMTRGMPEEALEEVLSQIPVGCMGLPEDIANAALFLGSDEARYVTGHVLNLNGGFYM